MFRGDAVRTDRVLPIVVADRAANARHWLVAIAPLLLVALAPALLFPDYLWPAGRWVAVALSLLAMALAVALLAPQRAFALLVALFAASVFIAFLRASEQRTALSHFGGVALGLLTMGVAAAWCRSERRLAWGTAGLLLAALGALAIGVRSIGPSPTKLLPLQWLKALLPQAPLPLPGVAANNLVAENPLGAVALVVVLVAFALARRSKVLAPSPWPLRVLSVLAGLFALFVILITQSRAVLIAAALTLIVAALRHPSGWRARARILVPVVVVPALIVGVIAVARPAEFARLSTEFNNALGSRTGLWRDGYAMLQQSPWLGVGLNNFRNLHQTNNEPDVHVHNVFLQTALDLGVPGFILYLALIAWVLVLADRAVRWSPHSLARRVAAGAGLAVVSLHFFGLGDAFALGAKLGGVQWLASGLILATSLAPAPEVVAIDEPIDEAWPAGARLR